MWPRDLAHILRIHYCKGYEDLNGAKMSLQDARQLLADVMRVLFYRDCRTINKITFGVIDKNGVQIADPISVKTDWNLEEINPVKNPDLSRMDEDDKKESN